MRSEPSTRIFLGLGSNLGDRSNHLAAAHRLLESRGIYFCRASPVYETPPWGRIDQPAFLNQVAEVRTRLAPRQLLSVLLAVEQAVGRTREVRWGPRTLDLDLLAYGATVQTSPGLHLPHPGIPDRAFVLVPWAAIAPEFVVTGFQTTVSSLLARLPDTQQQDIRIWEGDSEVVIPQNFC